MASDQTLDLVEQEIRRAEALLAHDIMQVDDDWSPGTQGRVAPTEPRITAERRKEIISNLHAERHGSEAAPFEGEEKETVPHTTAAPRSTPAPKSSIRTAPTPGGTERDILISRLLAEREAKLKAESARAAQPTPMRQQQQQNQQQQQLSTQKDNGNTNIHVRRSGSVVITQGEPILNVAPSTSRPAQTPQAPNSTMMTGNSQPRMTAPPVPTPQRSIVNVSTPSSSRNVRFASSSKQQQQQQQQQNMNSTPSSSRSFSSSHQSLQSRDVPESPMRWASETRSRRFSRRTKEDVLREAEERNKKECTFQPKINKKARFSQKTNQESRKQRFRRLSSTHAVREKQLAEERVKIQKKAMQECTFQPKINKTSNKNRSSKGRMNTKEGKLKICIFSKV